jgi:hypothetical protein
VLDKQTDRSFRTSILNAGSENDFNTISLGASKWNFEDLFQEVDTRSALLIAEILSRKSLAWLSEDDRLALADLFATQMLRTHFSRTTRAHLADRLREITRQLGYDPDQNPTMATPPMQHCASAQYGHSLIAASRSSRFCACIPPYTEQTGTIGS